MRNSEVFRTIKSLLGGLAAFALSMRFNLPLPMIIILPIAVYAGVYMLAKPVIKIGSLKLSDVKGEELKSLMKDAYEDLEVLEQAGKKVQDPIVRKLAIELYKSGISIFEHLQKNPEKIGLARRFINYYLDTAAGLLEKYQKLVSSRVRGASVEKAKLDIASGLNVLTRAFDQQYERLMQGEIMDITTDVKVLEQTLRSEE